MRDGYLHRHEVFVVAATLGAHVNGERAGFRQRDVRFLIELFSNWAETAVEGKALTVQNTQVLRYLDALVDAGHAKRGLKGAHPRYQLTPKGLAALIGRLPAKERPAKREIFFFLYYFLQRYGPMLRELLEKETRRRSGEAREEALRILDPKELIRSEIRDAEREIALLDRRIETARDASAALRRGRERLVPLPELLNEVAELHPTALHTERPFHEVVEGIPKELRAWELENGSIRRSGELWEPTRQFLTAYIGVLKDLP